MWCFEFQIEKPLEDLHALQERSTACGTLHKAMGPKLRWFAFNALQSIYKSPWGLQGFVARIFYEPCGTKRQLPEVSACNSEARRDQADESISSGYAHHLQAGRHLLV